MRPAGPQPEGEYRAIAPPRNFHKRAYLLGATTSYIILLPHRKYQLVAALAAGNNKKVVHPCSDRKRSKLGITISNVFSQFSHSSKRYRINCKHSMKNKIRKDTNVICYGQKYDLLFELFSETLFGEHNQTRMEIDLRNATFMQRF